jgi:HAD superfamily hydrolase (TIGR01549 family)
MVIKAILFDADETLYHIKPESAYRVLYAFLTQKLKIEPEKIRAAHRVQIEKVKTSKDPEKRHYTFALTWTLERLGVADSEAIVQEALDRFWSEVAENLSWESDIKETLSSLKKKYRIAIASDEFPENLEKKLSVVFGDWRGYFEFLITPRETGEMKPSTRYYQLALKQWGCAASEMLIVGDSIERDIKPAQSWGCSALLVSEEPIDEPVRRINALREMLSQF